MPEHRSNGGKIYNGNLQRQCNKWLCWAFVEAS